MLTEAMKRGGEVAKRAFNAMMKMQKIDAAERVIVHDLTYLQGENMCI